MQVWINLGPLLYHFAEAYSQEEVSCLICYAWLMIVYSRNTKYPESVTVTLTEYELIRECRKCL
ncbi:hypothetical protein KC19_4G073800 [Ceratodon purpureus]|uniref:Uncharacterized protein n=1 Tax=Ceratodon purpureus TaxID=3225 RepID=A0A8T0I821_CERPU|nr:hypothetical protein KC19_4G073800 [Ceratodon purpureus]